MSDSAIHQFDYLPRYIDVLEAFLSAQYVIKVFFFFLPVVTFCSSSCQDILLESVGQTDGVSD